MYRILLKSVKQIPRYGVSPKSGQCHAHCLILNVVHIYHYGNLYFLINAVLWEWQWSEYIYLQYQPSYGTKKHE